MHNAHLPTYVERLPSSRENTNPSSLTHLHSNSSWLQLTRGNVSFNYQTKLKYWYRVECAWQGTYRMHNPCQILPLGSVPAGLSQSI